MLGKPIMPALTDRLPVTRPVGAAVVAAAACLSAYLYIRPALRHRIRSAPTAVARGRTESGDGDLPYPPHVFPGGRDVDTPYGTIRVFEWGREDGEKVLLIHGIGTPSIALGDMAKHFVSHGCRVMLFGKYPGMSA